MKSISWRALVVLLSLTLAAGCGSDDPVDPDCTVGASCNDGDNTTTNDVFDADCNCAGTPTDCTGTGDADDDGVCSDVDCDDNDDLVTTQPGDACDDGDANTINDAIDGSCSCTGTCTVVGDACDDGDPDTYNDAYNSDCECAGVVFGTLTDTRDAQTYNTIEIGSQVWMAENLNYDGGVNWCFANTPSNCDTYGRLYDWETANAVCPTGWHLPDDDEWDTLLEFLGGQSVAGGKMKEVGTAHWNAPNAGATNSSGFTALPGGWRSVASGLSQNLRTNGTFWSASEEQAVSAWHRNLLFGGTAVDRGGSLKGDGLSVRCIQD